MKHTPGPWEAEEVFVYGRLGPRVADVTPHEDETRISDNEVCANAHLIAAAPELLEALKACCAQLSVFGEESSSARMSCDNARAAIAKAEGR